MPAIRTSKRSKASPETMASSSTTSASASSSSGSVSASSDFKIPLQPADLNQMSRMLQKRLEFARIKVENGWTEKSIVDLEALLPTPVKPKGPKPFPNARYPASLTVNAARPTPTHTPKRQDWVVPQGQVTLGFERLPSGVDFPLL